MCADIKDHFVTTPMACLEYMRVKYRYLPSDIRTKYNLDTILLPDDYIYINIKRGIYGLHQTAILSYDHLCTYLDPHGYSSVESTFGVWKHQTCPICFCVCVDDFCIKYFTKDDADYHLQYIFQHYQYIIDWKGIYYYELILNWNYPDGYVDISMLGALKKY